MKHRERGTSIRTYFGPLLFVIIATIALALTPAVALAQVDVSGQVTVSRSGLVFNRATQTYDLTISVTNTSPQALFAPLSLAMTSLMPASVHLANASGTLGNGMPYLQLPVTIGLPPAGKITGIVLQFSNPTRAKFSFTTAVWANSLDTPTITSIHPDEAMPGTVIDIAGKGFTPDSQVSIGGLDAPVTFVTESQLTAVVPYMLQRGSVVPLPPGAYPVIVDGSAPSTLIVVALPENSQPPGVVLTETVDYLVQTFNAKIQDIESTILQLQAASPSPDLKLYLDILHALLPDAQSLLNTVLPSLPANLDATTLATLERTLAPQIPWLQPASVASLSAQQAPRSIVDGDAWLEGRRELVTQVRIFQAAAGGLAACGLVYPPCLVAAAVVSVAELPLTLPLAAYGKIDNLRITPADAMFISGTPTDEEIEILLPFGKTTELLADIDIARELNALGPFKTAFKLIKTATAFFPGVLSKLAERASNRISDALTFVQVSIKIDEKVTYPVSFTNLDILFPCDRWITAIGFVPRSPVQEFGQPRIDCDFEVKSTYLTLVEILALFRPAYHVTFFEGATLTVNVSGPGQVTSAPTGIECPTEDCVKIFKQDKLVVLFATPDASGAFPIWTGCDTPANLATAATCTVKMADERDVTVQYTFPLTVTVMPPSVGTVTVTSSPTGINCPSQACTKAFPIESQVVLTATLDVNFAFPTWTGCDIPADHVAAATCTVTLTEARSVTATYQISTGIRLQVSGNTIKMFNFGILGSPCHAGPNTTIDTICPIPANTQTPAALLVERTDGGSATVCPTITLGDGWVFVGDSTPPVPAVDGSTQITRCHGTFGTLRRVYFYQIRKGP